jgi:hypothetical protein
MNISFDTLMSAFSEHVPPNSIIEQSLRTVYDLVAKGDAVTAQSILRYVNVPDALKAQLLNLTSTALVHEDSKYTQPSLDSSLHDEMSNLSSSSSNSESLTAMTVDDDDDLPIPIRSQVATEDATTETPSDLSRVFDAVTKDSEQEVDLPQPIQTQEKESSEPIKDVSLDTVPLLDLATQKETEKGREDRQVQNPTEALPHERNELFADVFRGVQTAGAITPSVPTVDTSQAIPVIHTYAEPEASTFQRDHAQKVESNKGEKIFSLFVAYLSKVESMNDGELRASAVRQWQQMNETYPEYRKYHESEWNEMTGRVQKLSGASKEEMQQPSKVDLLDEYILPSTARITPNLTITGESIYRIQAIESESGIVTVVFTDEIRKYRVPATDLDVALQNDSLDPDEFFKGFVV